MDNSLAISIINYNSKELVRNLLKKLLKTKNKNWQIWLVDNDSPDKGGRELKKEFPEINFIESKENGGFAKGHNLVLKQIKADYCLILNPDTEFEPIVIEKMLEFLKQNRSCGVASCKLLNPDKTIQANGGDLPLGMALLVWLFNLEMFGLDKIFGCFHRADDDYYQKAHEVGWVGGTFMFIKTEIFKKAGFLPEEYFMYFEDTDFCYQVQKKSIKVMINPAAEVTHSGGASSSNPRLAQFRGEMRGLVIFYRKEFGGVATMLVKFLVYLAVSLRIAAFGLLGKSTLAKTYSQVLQSI
jgi:GT2 family glycosyltransferase